MDTLDHNTIGLIVCRIGHTDRLRLMLTCKGLFNVIVRSRSWINTPLPEINIRIVYRQMSESRICTLISSPRVDDRYSDEFLLARLIFRMSTHEFNVWRMSKLILYTRDILPYGRALAYADILYGAGRCHALYHCVNLMGVNKYCEGYEAIMRVMEYVYVGLAYAESNYDIVFANGIRIRAGSSIRSIDYGSWRVVLSRQRKTVHTQCYIGNQKTLVTKTRETCVALISCLIREPKEVIDRCVTILLERGMSQGSPDDYKFL